MVFIRSAPNSPMAKNPKWFESREKNPRVGIAISAFGPLPTPFVTSLAEVMKAATFEGIVVDVMFDIKKPLDLSRNSCVKALLKNEPDYIFFMDSDMVFPSNVLVSMMGQGKDILTGVYCHKLIPHTPVLKTLDRENKRYVRLLRYPKDKLFRVDGCGCGCLLVKSKVFKKLEEPWFKMTMAKSEDMYFCEKALQGGFEVWADGRAECGHLSDYSAITPAQFWRQEDTLKKQLEKRAELEGREGKMPTYADYGGKTEEPR